MREVNIYILRKPDSQGWLTKALDRNVPYLGSSSWAPTFLGCFSGMLSFSRGTSGQGERGEYNLEPPLKSKAIYLAYPS